MTTLGVECLFKGMRADHDMPTVANYAYRRARSVPISGRFLIFYWAQFIFSGEDNQRSVTKHQDRTKEAVVMIKGTGSKEEDTKREAVMRVFSVEYGRNVRQENVHSKTKELNGTLPLALSMCPTTIIASSEEREDVTTACLVVHANVTQRDTAARVQTIYKKNDIVAVKHNHRRQSSHFWLKDVRVKNFYNTDFFRTLAAVR